MANDVEESKARDTPNSYYVMLQFDTSRRMGLRIRCWVSKRVSTLEFYNQLSKFYGLKLQHIFLFTPLHGLELLETS